MQGVNSTDRNSALPHGRQSEKDKSGIILLLSDHEKFGFSERACYHFDLIETLTQKPNVDGNLDASRTQHTILPPDQSTTLSPLKPDDEKLEEEDISAEPNEGDAEELSQHGRDHDPFVRPDSGFAGVVSLLECIPQSPIKKQKKRKRFLKKIEDFNKRAEEIRTKCLEEGSGFYCHQPRKLPIRLNFNTRVTFAYEMTRMVFCIDASPTLTSTFGNTGHSDGAICAMDRLEKMVRTYFNGLVVPISTGARIGKRQYDNNAGSSDKEENSKSLWVPDIVVTVIACFPASMTKEGQEKLSVLVSDFSVHDYASANALSDRIVAWATIEIESEIACRLGRIGGRLASSASSLQDIIVQCDAALSTMPSRGRPVIVVATDCRGVDCDSILDLVRDRKLKDIPLNVMDLSGSHSHRTAGNKTNKTHEGPNYLTFEVDSPSEFPLIIPDDSEALYHVCKSTQGYFIDADRLQEAVGAFAGSLPEKSSFAKDGYFSFKSRVVRPNALQWYTIFSLSPCCSMSNDSLPNASLPNSSGVFSPPSYIQERLQEERDDLKGKKKEDKKSIFSYPLDPIRAKGILIMRIMDRYRLRRYGKRSQDNDKVKVQFELNLEFGTVLHYEFDYVSSPSHNAMVGNAKVSISLSGEAGFIDMVKKKSELYSSEKLHATTLKEKACNRIFTFLKFIKDEDLIESEICALDWADKLTENSVFLRRLATLDKNHIYRHFRNETFEVIRVGDAMRQLVHLGKSEDDDSSSGNEVIKSIHRWSHRTLVPGRLYFRQLPMTEGNLTHYCIVEIKSTTLRRVCSIQVHYFEQVDTNERVACLKSLQSTIESSGDLLVVPRPLSRRVAHSTQESNLYQHEFWELLCEPELLPLVAKRRSYFDNFILVKFVPMEEVVLVKFVPDHSNRIYIVIYHLVMFSDKALARIYMDREQGIIKKIHSGTSEASTSPLFTGICVNVKERDHKCARALRSRRILLKLFDCGTLEPTELIAINHTDHVQRLLLYATKAVKKLRFFNDLFGQASSILEKLTIDFMLSGGLNSQVAEIFVGESQNIGELGKGRWFLVKFDAETIGIFHFPSTSISAGENISFRELSFFAVAFADLYYYKTDDINQRRTPEDDQTLFCLSTFFADLETANDHLYATAAYKSLRNPLRQTKESLSDSDFKSLLDCCTNVPIAENIEIKEPLGLKEDSLGTTTKLTTLLGSMLSPIPGGSPYLYFRGNENAAIEEFLENSSQSDDLDTVSSSGSSYSSHSDDGKDELEDHHSNQSEGSSFQFAAPIFVLLTIDGIPTSLSEISSIDRSVSFSAFLTVFKRASGINDRSKLQKAVSSLLKSHLDSYIAEQTLDQFLWEGKLASEVDLETVQRCLLEAENVITWSIALNFYMPNTDSMIDASSSKEGLDSCFYLLCSCLIKQKLLPVIEASAGQFLVTDTNLHGWCLINVPEAMGPVCAYAFHQNGIGAAESTAKEALDMVKNACHRVNQIQLLKRMQRSRLANELLIPADTTASSKGSKVSDLDLPAGFFQCGIAYKAFYKLHPPCSPADAIRDLQLTVLNSFAVSNRRDIFVYKDEKDKIFYMEFKPSEKDSQYGNGIELIVYGIQEPGGSITQQLDCLIKKKVMTMGVETISSVLTTSQHFNLPQSDVDFVKSFEEIWCSLDKENFAQTEEEFYEFPVAVDAILVLLCFRQNVSGSTFFNVWRRPREETRQGQNSSDNPFLVTQSDHYSGQPGVPFKFDHRDFSFCYNATQFQLNPAFQATSTLTEKGKEYSRKAGTGIALIEIKLVDSNRIIEQTVVGKVPGQELDACRLLQSLRFKRLQRNDVHLSSKNGRCRLSVRIFNTTLKADAIYRWIELTLNQALVSWVIERHLERARLGLLHFPIQTIEDQGGQNANLTLPVSRICQGLPSLAGILSSTFNLPHPAVKKLDFPCRVKTTELASLFLNCLERGVLSPLFGSKKVGAKDIAGLQTLRLCKSHSSLVELKHLEPFKYVQVYDKDTGSLIVDRPMDSPQFIAVYGLNEVTEKVRRKDILEKTQSQFSVPPGSFLFQKVSVDDYLDDRIPGSLSNALKELTLKDPYAFMRRVALILAVNRLGVSALFYNLNPHKVESIDLKMKEIHHDFTKQTNERIKVLRSRYNFMQSIGSVKVDVSAPSTLAIRTSRRIPSNTERPQVASIPEENEAAPINKEKKKRSILIPTIVGKSVKGSAYQAQLHRRASARVGSSKIVQGRSTSQRVSTQKGRDTGTKSSSKPTASSSKSFLSASKSPSSNQEKEKKGEEERNYLPPLLKKHFTTLQSFVTAKALRRSQSYRLYQSMILNYFLDLEGKELPFLSMDTITRYGTALQTTIFPLVPCAVADPTLFLLYFAKNAFQDPSKTVTLSKNFVWNAQNLKTTGNVEKTTIFFMQKMMCTTSSDVYLIHELSAIRLKFIGKVGKCRSWVYIGESKTKDFKNLLKDSTKSSRKRPSKDTIYRREKESNKVIQMSHLALAALQPNMKMFMFALNMLRRCSKGDIDTKISPAQLLRETMFTFPPNIQLKNRVGYWYRLLKRTIFLDKAIIGELLSLEKILKQLCSEPDAYDIVVCSNDDLCLSTSVPCDFKDAHLFITRNQSRQHIPEDCISFDLYVLCCTRGSTLERYIFVDGSAVARKLSDHILDTAESKIHDLMKNASADIDRNEMWKKLTCKNEADQIENRKERQIINISLQDIKKLVSVSYSLPYSDFDQRMVQILQTDLRELENLQLSSLIQHLVEDGIVKCFHCCNDGEGLDISTYILCLDRFDVILLMEVEKDNKLTDFQLVGRNSTYIREEVLRSNFKEVVEIIDLSAFMWIWSSS